MFKDTYSKVISNEVNEFLEPEPNPYYYDIDSNKDLEIEYGKPINEVYNFVRAWSFKDRPKPYFNFNGKKVELNYER